MLGVTIFGIFFTPVFYVVVRWLTERKTGDSSVPAELEAIPATAATSPDGETAITSKQPKGHH